MIRTDRRIQAIGRGLGSVARPTVRVRWSIPLIGIALFMLFFATQEVHAAPRFGSTSYQFTATENFWSGSRPAVRVGTVTATESGETITYSLEGPDRSRFSIDRNTGVLTTKAGKAISNEHKPIYEVRVRATGDGSKSVIVLVWVTRVERTATRTLLEMYGHEREPKARDVGSPIPAVDGSTSETFTYSIEDTFAGSMFQIDASSGQLKTKPGQLYNYEPDDEHGLLVFVRVADSDGVSNLILVTVNLTDRDEPPRKIVGPCSTEQTATSLTVEWGTGHFYGYPQTKSYDLRYRQGKTATTNRGRWTNGEQGVPRTRPQSTISGLEPDTYYEVAIRGTNDEGTGDWSTSNCSVRFNSTDRAATSMSQSNSPAAGNIGIQGIARVGETLTATTSGIRDDDGLDNAVFAYQWVRSELGSNSETDIAGATGSSYAVTAEDAGKAITVRVTFTDDAGNVESLTSYAVVAAPGLPDAPGTPDVSPQESGSLAVSWTGPASDGGSAVTGYKVQWKEAADSWDTAADVSEAAATGTSHTITGLTDGTEYTVRVLAINDVGESPPSAEESATVAAQISRQGAAPQNAPATGAPTISGTVQVGETLTASASGIADADGLTSVSYSYQWIRNDGTSDSDISGATSSTYTLADADEGNTIKVRVSFTDDAGNEETLTSAATGEVAAVPSPLTVSLENSPASHNGTDVFTFQIRFSEELKLSFKTLRDHAFTVDGGTVKKAKRQVKGSNIGWTITVEPDSDAAVRIVLPATTGCDGTGAICTEDGRKLSNSLDFTVSGPS